MWETLIAFTIIVLAIAVAILVVAIAIAIARVGMGPRLAWILLMGGIGFGFSWPHL